MVQNKILFSKVCIKGAIWNVDEWPMQSSDLLTTGLREMLQMPISNYQISNKVISLPRNLEVGRIGIVFSRSHIL